MIHRDWEVGDRLQLRMASTISKLARAVERSKESKNSDMFEVKSSRAADHCWSSLRVVILAPTKVNPCYR